MAIFNSYVSLPEGKPIFCKTCFVFFLESEGTPSYLPYFHRIFHEINHPAIGVPPLMEIPA